MDKVYKVITVIAVILCILLMTWNVFLIKENSELKKSISIME